MYIYQKNKIKKIILISFILISNISKAQFLFTGSVNTHYKNATVYIQEIKDLKKRDLFIPENIIQESKIINGNFNFSGDYLSDRNRFYKIYLDNCSEGISNSKHLLNQCTDNISVLFIAKNTDTIYFPLNDLNQVFCSFNNTSSKNLIIHKIDSIQESTLINLPISKNDRQREIIYKNYYEKLQNYSKSLNEPLAELYAFCLYSDENSFSRKYYLKDLKSNGYYDQLSKKLQKKYPKSLYSNQFLRTLQKDFFYTNTIKTKFNNWWYLIAVFLVLSVLLNIFLLRSKYKSKVELNYKEVLTTQEQKIFNLMHQAYSNKQIAAELFISLSTVKTHINNIYSKLKISSRKDIARFFKP